MEIVEIFQGLFGYLTNPYDLPSPLYELWWWIRAGFILVTMFFVGVLIFLYFVSDYQFYRFKETMSEYKKFKPHWGIKLDYNWDDILKQSKDDNESERKLAIIEADDMIDSILGQMGYQGETLLEKLEGLNKEILPFIEELKEAHRVKRDLVYDPNKSISKEETKKIISYYEETFKDLQVF